MVGNAIAQSAQPIISYNFGLGRSERVAATERIALTVSVVCGVLITAVFALFPRALVGLFIDSESAAARLAIAGFPYFSTAFVFFILNLCVIGYYQSVEQVRPAVFLRFAARISVFGALLYPAARAIGMKGIWLTLFVSEAPDRSSQRFGLCGGVRAPAAVYRKNSMTGRRPDGPGGSGSATPVRRPKRGPYSVFP